MVKNGNLEGSLEISYHLATRLRMQNIVTFFPESLLKMTWFSSDGCRGTIFFSFLILITKI
jgi:hypothetical protein